ncbi:MAG: tail fiber domain-containing protein [Acidobacteria bacterium]|nr:tail fiber domain-containing protein [Acidobacteriota bacterium]
MNNATALGTQALVEADNSLVLGSIAGKNGATTSVNVGIGTTTPGERLHVAGNGRFIGNLSASGSVVVDRNATNDGTNNGGLFPGLVFGADPVSSGEGIASKRTAGGNQFGLDLYTGYAARLSVTSGGNIGIGMTAPADKLHVAGEARVNSCVKNSGGTAIAGTCASDRRFKCDITAFPNMLDQVARLRPVHFYWRSQDFPQEHFGAEQSYGLIAQEAEAVLPELVETRADGYKAVNYSKLPLLMLQAVKELKAENDALKQRNAQQQQLLNAMQERLQAIERALAPKHSAPRRTARTRQPLRHTPQH